MTILMLLLILQVGCRSTETVRIGLIVDLSGKSSTLGIASRDAAMLAVERYNEENFGTTYELVVKDTHGDADTTRDMVKELVDESVELIIGPMTSGEVDNIKDYLITGEVVFISPTVATDDLSGIDDYMFRIIGAASLQAETLAYAAYEVEKNRNAIVIYDSNNQSFGLPVAQRFDEITTKHYGHNTYMIDYDSSSTDDFSKYIDEVIAYDADGVLFIGPSEDAAVFLQQLKLAGFDGGRYLTLWSNTKELVSGAGDTLNGTYITSAFSTDGMTKAMHDYERVFVEKFGYNPDFMTYYTDEAFTSLFSAIEKSGSTSAKDIKIELSGGLSVEGYGLEYTINEHGDSNKQYVLMQYKDNKLQRVK